MDIAKLGVAIDPAKAVEGTARVKAALKDIGATAHTELGKVDAAQKKAGDGAVKMGQNSRRGVGEFSRGIVDMLNSVGMMDNGFGRMVQRMTSTVASFQNLRGVAGSLAGGLRGVGTEAAAAGSGAAAGAGGLASFAAIGGTVLAVVAALVVAIGGLAATYKAFAVGIPLAAKFEQDRVAMETLIGNADATKVIMQDLANLGAKTPLETPELMNAARSLLAFGEAGGQVVNTLRMVGDVSQGVQARIGDIAEIYGKARVQGTLFAEDINQLTGRGIPVIQEFAKQLGVSTSQVKKMGSEGKLSFDNLERAFVSLTSKGGKFYQMMARQADTFNGKLSTLSDNWNAMLRDMSAPVMEALKPMIDKLINAVAMLTPYAVAFGQTIANGITALAAAISSGQLMELLGMVLTAGIEQAAANMLTIFQLNIMGLVQLVIGGFSTAIQFLVNLWATLFTTVTDTITQIIQGDWSGAFSTVATFFQNLFTGGGNIIGNIGQVIINTLGEAFEKVVNVFIQAFYKAWSSVAGLIDAGLAKLDSAAGFFGGSITTRMGGPGKAPGNIDFFTPKPVTFGNITAASDSVVGTGNRDALQKKIAELSWKPELMGPPAPLPKVEAPKAPTAGGVGGGAGGKPKDITDGAPKAKEVESEMKSLLDAWKDTGKQIDHIIAGITESLANNMTNAIVGLIEGTKTLKQAFSEMAAAIVHDILTMIVKAMIYQAIIAALGPYAAGFQALAVMGAQAGGAMAHTGGEVGKTNLSNTRVPVYHTGGTLSSESMVKVDKGETILTRRRSADLARELESRRQPQGRQSGQSSATIINVLDRNEIADVVAKNPGAVVNALSRNLPQVRRMIMSGQRA